jgi:hypothetical protein
LRRECLDHILIAGPRHLEVVSKSSRPGHLTRRQMRTRSVRRMSRCCPRCSPRGRLLLVAPPRPTPSRSSQLAVSLRYDRWPQVNAPCSKARSGRVLFGRSSVRRVVRRC